LAPYIIIPLREHVLKIIFYPLLLLLAVQAAPASPDSDSAWAPEYGLYRDISQEQSDLAHEALEKAYGAKPKESHKTLSALKALETKDTLPPLSHLISLAVDVMRYQNGDFESREEEKALLNAIEESAEQGRYLCERALHKEPGHPTALLILGGIRGYLATLKIQSNPSQALNDGLQAVKLLEKARQRDPRVKDSYMGTGIFNCTADNAPLFVRATLKIIGRSVSMKSGLEALRISAYEGQYTSVASQLFLIQFLTPYDEELKREKRQIFRSLEETFPRNPYYTFMKLDEALCFYPDTFFRAETRQELEARLGGFTHNDFTTRRYANLLRWQYALLNPKPSKALAPDTSVHLRDYAFYPAFIEALRFKREMEDSLEDPAKAGSGIKRALKDWRDSCFDLIAESPMSAARKRYYRWHVTDALRWNPKRRLVADTVETVTGKD
jgi:hypothetical protein